MTMVTMRDGSKITPGCWVDGHHGQYAVDTAAGIASLFGWTTTGWRHSPERIRRVAEWVDCWPEPIRSHMLGEVWDMHAECYDRITDWLNEHTIDGYWEWIDGELFCQHESARELDDEVAAEGV